jgi:hypothetical protein
MSKHAFAISPRVPREFFWKSFALGDQRAQEKPDARCTRGLACNMHKKRTRAYSSAAFRQQWFAAYIALSPVAHLPPSPAGYCLDQWIDAQPST